MSDARNTQVVLTLFRLARGIPYPGYPGLEQRKRAGRAQGAWLDSLSCRDGIEQVPLIRALDG